MKNICLILFLIGGIYACSDSEKSNKIAIDNTIEFNATTEVFIPDFVDSVSYLKLQNCEDAFISHISKVIVRNNQIYIGDFIHHKIVVYNMDGSFKFSIDKKGRGPEEYLEVKSFSVDDSVVYVMDNFKRSLQMYDNRTGEYIGKKKMPFVAWDLEVLNNGMFVFAYSPLEKGRLLRSQPRYRLFFTDKNMKVVKEMFPYREKEFDPIAKNSFFSSSADKIIYNWCISDFFVVIDKNNIDSIQTIQIDFGGRKVPEALRKNFNIIDKEYNYIYSTPMINGNYLALEVAIENYFECFIYDLRNKKMASNAVGNMFNTMSFPNCVDSKGRFLYVIENKKYYDDLVADGFPRANEDIEVHLEEGIAAIFYQMKESEYPL